MLFKNSMGHRLVCSFLAVCFLLTAFSSACTSRQVETPPMSLTIVHVSDTHSYDTPSRYMFKINGVSYLATLGGWGLLMSAVEDIRSQEKNVLLLHAGDMLQGTMFTPKFEGAADIECMNTMRFDAFTPGNHEFATGIQPAIDITNKAKFPVLAANMDVSGERGLAGKIKAYTISEFEGNKVGIIGLITPDTKFIGYTGNIVFMDPADTARRCIAELNAQGINKIIVLSHLGYAEDAKLANAVDGIDIIVGGHSHTFMGGQEFERLGLKPEMPYPSVINKTDGGKVLIVHSWAYNRLFGKIKIDFDSYGNITDYSGQPIIYTTDRFQTQYDLGWYYMCHCMHEYSVIHQELTTNPGTGIYSENTEITDILQPYLNKISGDMQNVVAFSAENLIIGTNKGPGPVIADAFLWNARKTDPDVQIAIYDSYDVRSDIYKGDVTVGDINMLLPLQQKLVTFNTSGGILKLLLEMGIDSHLKINKPLPCFEISGMRMTIDISRPSGDRITSIEIQNADGEYQPLDKNRGYKVVTTDYLADKGIAPLLSRMGPLTGAFEDMVKSYLNLQSLDISDVDAMTDYMKTMKIIKNTTDIRTFLLKTDANSPR